jgi:DNA-binding CsgD family transcriptional regulator
MEGGSLIERMEELAEGAALLGRALAGNGGLAVIEGPAGIGKTALLGALAERSEGFRVLRASGDDLERSLAFGIVRQLFERPLARDEGLRERVLGGAACVAAGVVLPGERGTPAPSSAAAVNHGLTWLAANLAEERPLLLLIDDLQWSDPASLEWLAHLGRRVEELPLALIATWRIGEPGSEVVALDRLRDEPSTLMLRPDPLSPEGTAQLVRHSLGKEVDGKLCDVCARATGGNPFLLIELLRSVSEQPQIEAAAIDSLRPESIGRSVERRLERLPPSARRAAEACAVLGEGAELRHVEALAGLHREEAVSAADALTDSGILAAGRPLRFLHPLVREAVYQGLGEQARSQAHAAAARLLAGEGAEDLQVATHLVAAPPAADPWAIDRLYAAGQTALLRGAPIEASELFERALLEPPPESCRHAIRLTLGIAESRQLRMSGVAHLQAVVAESPSARERGEAVLELVKFDVLAYQTIDLEALERARADLGEEDRELRLLLTGAIVAAGQFIDRSVEAASAEASRLLPELSGETPAERRLLAAVAFRRALRQEAGCDACAALAEQAMGDGRLVEEANEDASAVEATVVLLNADRDEAATTAIEAALRTARTRGSELAFGIWSTLRCYRGWIFGDLLEAEADGYSALAAAGKLPLVRTSVVAFLARVLIDRGELQEADRLLVSSLSPPGAEKTRADTLARLALAELRSAQGRWDEAAEAVLAVVAHQSARGEGGIMPWRPTAAVALARSGEVEEARRLIAEQRLIDWNLPRFTGLTLRGEGLIEGGEEGIELLRRAAEILAATPARLEHARALLDLGAMLRRENQRVEAREVLARSLDLADRCGAGRLVALAREEIAATGARPRRMRLYGVDSLTASEHRVARMAAEGMSNPEIAQALFVTRKTVEKHLGNVYMKLEIPSRDQLPEALAGPGESRD